MTKDLSAFFRISISKGKEYIPLGEELRHVALYLDIQKARYADSIAYSCEVPENMLAYYMPKLLLQPLVAVSYTHLLFAFPTPQALAGAPEAVLRDLSLIHI